MRILIVGNGGREHALLWKLRRDAPDADFFVTRPNGGMEGACLAVDLHPESVNEVATWAEDAGMDLVVVGPEAPLASGLADRLRSRGVPVFGPSAQAARIESSKAYAKSLMRRHRIATAAHRTFDESGAAHDWVRERGAPIVVKASGLAAGKGAVVCQTESEAHEAVDAMLADDSFGTAGREVVIEEFMEGEELSVFAVASGRSFMLLAPSQDHKRVGEGDVGPNTGGMGAYAPVALADERTVQQAAEEIIAPTLRALEEDGAPFHGLLYAGLMAGPTGLRVVEFNCRFGDPETQAVLPLLDASLLELLMAVAGGENVAEGTAPVRPGAAVTTVLASGGYPGAYEKGKTIEIPTDLEDENLLVFHAGTRREDGHLVTSGGRVLSVTALAPTVGDAADRSREAVGRIHFEGAYFRRDIGWRERRREEHAK